MIKKNIAINHDNYYLAINNITDNLKLIQLLVKDNIVKKQLA